LPQYTWILVPSNIAIWQQVAEHCPADDEPIPLETEIPGISDFGGSLVPSCE
jgi:hypothetical protein